MSIVDLPLTLISSPLYPEKEIISTLSLKANKEKSPFISEIVPVVVSLIIIVAVSYTHLTLPTIYSV